MRKFFVIILMMLIYTTSYAQQLTVKKVNLRFGDLQASTNPRDDGKGKDCAIIRVSVVGVDNLTFPDAIGTVEHSLNEYVVYVPDGLKKLKYKDSDGHILGFIDFDDYDMEIESKTSYDVIFESENHLRSAIFSIQPSDAILVFDNEKIKVNNEGVAIINKPIGDYSYRVVANGYLSQSGTMSLVEDEISTVTDIILEQLLYPVSISVFPMNASVFIDNVPYSRESMINLKLPEGKHTVRVTAENYQEEERTINVTSTFSPEFITLKEVKQEIVKHKEESTKTSINIRNAFYITGNFAFAGINDIGNIFGSGNALDFGIEASYVFHFAGIFGGRIGASLHSIKPNKNEKYFDLSVYNDSIRWLMSINIPLQVGISIPFGNYNRHLFSVFAGGYGGYIGMMEDWAERELSEEEKLKDIPDVNNPDKDYFDYGIRLSAKLDVGHFTLGMDLSQSLHDMGFSAGANIGIKLFRLKKKKI